jgi:MoaA/NifB/PqqE/SkfB family radical SAM enzyme
MIVLTDRCNLNCAHCYNKGLKSRAEMDTGEIQDLLDQLARTGTLGLTLTGGEPTYRPDWKEIVSYALRRRFLTVLKTNGTLISAQDVETLWEMGLCQMTVSLYSHDADRHDAFVRSPGAWEQTLANAVRFNELGGKCRVSIVVMGWNAPDVPSLLDLCDENGLPYAVDAKVTARLDGNSDPCELRATEDQLVRIFSDPRTKAFGIESDCDPFVGDAPICSPGQRSVCIRPDGEVWPCISLPWTMGNVRDRPYREIVSNSKVVEKACAITWGQSGKCSACSSSWACNRCPGDAFVENGDVNAPTPIECAVARAKIRFRENDQDHPTSSTEGSSPRAPGDTR